jgi:hypothetical protein
MLQLLSLPMPSVIAGIVAFAITQNVVVAASVFAICIGYTVCSALSFIPFLGVFLQYIVVVTIMNPWIASTFVMPASVSWILNAFFWISIVVGAITTLLITIALNRKENRIDITR